MKSAAIIGIVVVIIIIGASAAYYATRGGAGAYSTNTTTIAQSTVATTTIAVQHNTTTIPASTGNSTSGAYNVKIASKAGIGQYLVNASGWSLYMFKQDTQGSGVSSCYGACATAWPVFYVGNINAAPGITTSWFSQVSRTDGSKQLAYNGLQLYYYKYDTAPGTINGQGVAGWYLVSPAGTVITNSTH